MRHKLINKIAVATMLAGVAGPVATGVTGFKAAQLTTVSADFVPNPQQFLQIAIGQAQRAAKKYGVYPSVMISQSIWESGWGASGLAVQANNLFGIKVGNGWTGEQIIMKTGEETVNGKKYNIMAAFRKYPSYEASYDDNGAVLRYNPNYYSKTFLENSNSYSTAVKGLKAYATAHDYITKIGKLVSQSGLNQYDPTISWPNTTYYASQNAHTYGAPTNHDVTWVSGNIVKGQKYVVDKMISYPDGSKRLHLAGLGWVNNTVVSTTPGGQQTSQPAKPKTPAKPKVPAPKPVVVKKPKKVKKPKHTKHTNVRYFTTKKSRRLLVVHRAYLYGLNRKRVAGNVAAGSYVNTYGYVLIFGHKYYELAGHKYLAAGNIDGTGRILRRRAYLYNSARRRVGKRTYRVGLAIRTYGDTVSLAGKAYYLVGRNQYIKRTNF
ncbi:MAG: glucosaminidase domain-containing protein [Lactobacillus sp.]|nr:glucosaminidase domain-containing protein [Lactobacillus sp.]MDN6052515.1 glucosaminidase domain-containing protein [Lactobacillus sp.]